MQGFSTLTREMMGSLAISWLIGGIWPITRKVETIWLSTGKMGGSDHQYGHQHVKGHSLIIHRINGKVWPSTYEMEEFAHQHVKCGILAINR